MSLALGDRPAWRDGLAKRRRVPALPYRDPGTRHSRAFGQFGSASQIQQAGQQKRLRHRPRQQEKIADEADEPGPRRPAGMEGWIGEKTESASSTLSRSRDPGARYSRAFGQFGSASQIQQAGQQKRLCRRPRQQEKIADEPGPRRLPAWREGGGLASLMENTVLLGDNLELLDALSAGLADLIYVDPPFNTGR